MNCFIQFQGSACDRGWSRSWQRGRGGFSLIETLVSVVIMGITFLALYGGIAAGFSVIQLARENLRATQVIQEKMETIRLYSWDQINSNGFIPPTFTAPFYATNDVLAGGLVYHGSVTVSNAPLAESYSNDVRMVAVTVRWTSGKADRERSMSTFVSRYGLQNYVY